MGSKRRIAKEILPLMLAEREIGQFWVEPFVGGGNMIDKVTGNRIGSDVNPYTIQALISIRDNVDQLPKNNQEFTESDYKALRISDDYKFKGYAGFAFAFGAIWLGGWRRCSRNADYVKESYNSAVKQSPYLQGIELYTCSYDELFIPKNSIIYCDPPYANTTKYKDSIDHDKFWNWCRQKAKQGHKVFISEYNAPDDFKCIWEKKY
jgi:DNA adenine methylase